jgi:hypothetical protein
MDESTPGSTQTETVECTYCRPLLSAYARNELSIEIVLPIQRHLLHCLDCTSELIQFVTVDTHIRKEMGTTQLTDHGFWMRVSRIQKKTFETLSNQTGGEGKKQ